MRLAFPLILLLASGCDLLGVGGDSDTSTTHTTDWQPVEGAWAGSSHPCFGNRTDAMWWDSKSTVFVGCGSTTVGYGLFRSTDGGSSWSSVAESRLSGFRVSSIQRGGDALLYIAGIDTNSRDRVLSVDDNDAVQVVYEAGDQFWSSFHVGTFRRNNQGVAVAESLTGTGLVWRDGDGAAFQDGSDWPTDGGSYQILDMVLDGGGFYGSGSTIATPPHVFVPDSTDPFALRPVQLADWSGELWGIDVDGGEVVAGGVNQNDNDGMIFVSGSDPADADGWSSTNVTELVGSGPTWIRGVCRSGSRIAAVGEFSMLADPILVVSADGGNSWSDWTDALPSGAEALHRCEMWADGRLAVTGQSGYLAVWTPAGG